MANLIELAKSYVPLLDEVYKNASLTSILDGAPELVQQGANANELIVPMMDMDGLANCSTETSKKARYIGQQKIIYNQAQTFYYEAWVKVKNTENIAQLDEYDTFNAPVHFFETTRFEIFYVSSARNSGDFFCKRRICS